MLQPYRVVVANGLAFGCILIKDFLKALAKRLNFNATAYENYFIFMLNRFNNIFRYRMLITDLTSLNMQI